MPPAELNLFVKLAKIDEARREVWGVLAEEKADKVDEIFDYASSKPLFEKWSSEFAKTTNGKSLGNVRAMHGKTAAGKLIDVQYRDAEKQVYVGAKVIDDQDWKKCLEGVYTGFSIGGKYVKTWDDGAFKRYTAQPIEASLVDNPCMYGATFDAVKADGAIELRKFHGLVSQAWKCAVPAHSHDTKAEAIRCNETAAKDAAQESDMAKEKAAPTPEELELAKKAETEKVAAEAKAKEKLEKAEKAAVDKSVAEQLTDLRAEVAKLKTRVRKRKVENKELRRVAKKHNQIFEALIEKMGEPAPSKGVVKVAPPTKLRAVSKDEDVKGAAAEEPAEKATAPVNVEKKHDEFSALEAIKKSNQSPIALDPMDVIAHARTGAAS